MLRCTDRLTDQHTMKHTVMTLAELERFPHAGGYITLGGQPYLIDTFREGSAATVSVSRYSRGTFMSDRG